AVVESVEGAAGGFAIGDNVGGVGVFDVSAGAVTRGAVGQGRDGIAWRDDAVFGRAVGGAPAAAIDSGIEGGIQSGAIDAGLAAADDGYLRGHPRHDRAALPRRSLAKMSS